VKKFKPSLKTREIIRTELGFNEEDWVYLFLGRLNRDKAILDLVSTFSEIKTDYNQKLIFVGHDEENLVSGREKEFKNNNILLVPFSNKPEVILQACDTFCLPINREGFGLSVIEASALAKPIICSDIYGLKNTIKENTKGIRHKKGDSQDLKRQLAYALNNIELMNTMGANSRNYVEEHFSDTLVLKEWLRFYGNSL